MDESMRSSPGHRLGIGAATVVVAGAVLAFALRGDPSEVVPGPESQVEAGEDLSVDAGPEAAVVMIDRLQLFRAGGGVGRLEFTGPDLTALLRHAVPGMIPDGVHDPAVLIDGDEVRVRARVSHSELLGAEALGDVIAVLPDDVEVELRGTLHRASTSEIEYRIGYASVAGVRLPSSVVAALVRSWPGGSGRPGDAAVLRAPWSVRDGRVGVAGGLLVVERPEPIRTQSVDGSDGV